MKNYHKKDCPWNGVDLNNDDACDQMDDTPCICTDSDLEEAVQQDIEQRERQSSGLNELRNVYKKAPECAVITNFKPPTPGYHKLGTSAQAAARSRAKTFYPFD